MCIGLLVLFLSGFNTTRIFFDSFFYAKHTNIKFHENSSRGSRVVPCGRTGKTKKIVAFYNFVNAPKKTTFKKIETKHKINTHFSLPTHALIKP